MEGDSTVSRYGVATVDNIASCMAPIEVYTKTWDVGDGSRKAVP